LRVAGQGRCPAGALTALRGPIDGVNGACATEGRRRGRRITRLKSVAGFGIVNLGRLRGVRGGRQARRPAHGDTFTNSGGSDLNHSPLTLPRRSPA
jgi:hypothetical protein